MICERCGHSMPDGSLTCENCGTYLGRYGGSAFQDTGVRRHPSGQGQRYGAHAALRGQPLQRIRRLRPVRPACRGGEARPSPQAGRDLSDRARQQPPRYAARSAGQRARARACAENRPWPGASGSQAQYQLDADRRGAHAGGRIGGRRLYALHEPQRQRPASHRAPQRHGRYRGHVRPCTEHGRPPGTGGASGADRSVERRARAGLPHGRSGLPGRGRRADGDRLPAYQRRD